MNKTIDELDRKILRILCNNGRASIVQLSEETGLSQTPCKKRLHRLEEMGLISGYGAMIDRAACGFGITAFVNVELESHKAEDILGFQKDIAHFEEIVTAALMTGGQDFLLEVVVASLEEYEHFLQTRLAQVRNIRNMRSRFALKKFIERSRIP